jgi:hypothetical protein
MPEENKISFADPSAYPMLNERENLFDLAHLNSQGARVFTEIFADEFVARIDKQNGLTPTELVTDHNKSSSANEHSTDDKPL